MLTIQARPEPVSIEPRKTAVIVVDMQNGFASKSGYLDRLGFDISAARTTVARCKQVIDAAHAAGVLVVHLQMGWHPDLRDSGRPHGAMWHKSVALRYMREHKGEGAVALLHGSWDYEIVDELKPEPRDIVVPKTRLSGFFETTLDSVLRARGIEALAFVGIATNVCVEATIRDALYRDYLSVLIEDACNAAGPDFVRQASVFNVEFILGWVATTKAWCEALAGVGTQVA